MKSAAPKIVNGVVGLSVLAMFIVAIVAGQARSNFATDAQSIASASTISRLAKHAEATKVKDTSTKSQGVER
jgi:hypothetical protein